jgi:hypothetical protein
VDRFLGEAVDRAEDLGRRPIEGEGANPDALVDCADTAVTALPRRGDEDPAAWTELQQVRQHLVGIPAKAAVERLEFRVEDRDWRTLAQPAHDKVGLKAERALDVERAAFRLAVEVGSAAA